jgi:hypothetical protein
MKQKKKTAKKLEIAKVDKGLDRFLEMGLFQDKVDKANRMLKTIGLPPQLMK